MVNVERLKNCLAINYSAQTKHYTEFGRYSPSLEGINISPVLKSQCSEFYLSVSYNQNTFQVVASYNGIVVGEVNSDKEIRLKIN